MKFGGTSVADLERIRRVARLVAAEVATGKQVAVVVSAMSGKTNELVAWTDGSGRAAQGLPESDDEYDAVVASGEQVTAGLHLGGDEPRHPPDALQVGHRGAAELHHQPRAHPRRDPSPSAQGRALLERAKRKWNPVSPSAAL
jgi:hypothetical protein